MERIPITISYKWQDGSVGFLQLTDEALELFSRGDYCIVPTVEITKGKIVRATIALISIVDPRTFKEMRENPIDYKKP